jgi:RNA polymerase sigma-70 factor (ECF subfamily)
MPIDPQTLQQLIHAQWLPLLYWIGRDRHWAEDVVQEAFVKLAIADPVPDAPVAWLYRVSKNLAINAQRQQTNRAAREQLASQRSVPRHSDISNAEMNELSETLDRMPAAVREIIVARIWGDLSFEEIAVMSNSNKATVWRTFQSGLEELRRIYEVQGVRRTYE